MPQAGGRAGALGPPRQILKGKYKRVRGKSAIGQGAYGKVYLYRESGGRRLVAVKHVRVNLSEGPEGEGTGLDSAVREASILMELRHAPHENIVRMQEIEVEKSCGDFYLVFEFLKSSLNDYVKGLRRREDYNHSILKALLHQMLKGVNHLHKRKICHRDLKPANILVDEETTKLKLIDFGLARNLSLPARCLSPQMMTLWYRAPEVLLGAKKYTTAVDMWSIGCIFAELIFGRAPFRGNNEVEQLWDIFQKLGTPKDFAKTFGDDLPLVPPFPAWTGAPVQVLVPGLDPVGVDLLQRMLVYSPWRRISAQQALRHKFFDELEGEGSEGTPPCRPQPGCALAPSEVGHCPSFDRGCGTPMLEVGTPQGRDTTTRQPAKRTACIAGASEWGTARPREGRGLSPTPLWIHHFIHH